jgi:hypothetical protein
VSLSDPRRRIFDDGAGMHKYSLCIVWIVVVSASDPNDLFVKCVTMFIEQSHG